MPYKDRTKQKETHARWYLAHKVECNGARARVTVPVGSNRINIRMRVTSLCPSECFAEQVLRQVACRVI
jgi:hypothetical protein